MTAATPIVRPGWDEWFMRQAYIASHRASCRRKAVGALIVDGAHRVIAGGYNGAPHGLPDCIEVGCDVRVIDGRESCVRTLHAESNALDQAGRDAAGCTLYTTVKPCRPCALRILQAGIRRVVYAEGYVSQGTNEVDGLFLGTRCTILKVFSELCIPATFSPAVIGIRTAEELDAKIAEAFAPYRDPWGR